ncbi:MAG TPA: hypothetical protein VK922_15330 [Gemmatimonadaceae bacterium]|nr:hypothetical protein [Gemmatimonadaceae bacterium]
MRRSKRLKSMARAYRAGATLAARLWRGAPWILTGSILLALGVLGSSDLASEIAPVWRWSALSCAAAAPVAAVYVHRRRRQHPGRLVTGLTIAITIAAIGHLAANLILWRENSFYSAALLTEGALLLFALTGIQAALGYMSPAATTAAPRAADAFMDGVTVLLIAFLGFTYAALRPAAAVAFLLALGFAAFAVVLRTPGALARIGGGR